MSEQQQQIESVSFAFTIDNSRLQDIEPVYANHVQLYSTPNEIVINFGRVDAPANLKNLDPSAELIVFAKPVARIVLPHQVFESFAKLVERQFNAFLIATTTGPSIEGQE